MWQHITPVLLVSFRTFLIFWNFSQQKGGEPNFNFTWAFIGKTKKKIKEKIYLQQRDYTEQQDSTLAKMLYFVNFYEHHKLTLFIVAEAEISILDKYLTNATKSLWLYDVVPHKVSEYLSELTPVVDDDVVDADMNSDHRWSWGCLSLYFEQQDWELRGLDEKLFWLGSVLHHSLSLALQESKVLQKQEHFVWQ